MPIGAPTRAAQPPGGRCSFAFNDGSDARVSGQGNPYQRAPTPLLAPGGLARQPPGGSSSVVFDDSISRGTIPERRHTNGMLMLRPVAEDRQATGAAAHLRDPTSSLPLAASTRHHVDALDEFVNVSSKPASRPEPPGGRASFSLGWGGDDARDHSKPAASRPEPPGGRSSFSFGWGADDARYNPSTGRAEQPPGGRSSFSLGWGSDRHCNHHTQYNTRTNGYNGATRPHQSADAGMPVAHAASNTPFGAAFAQAPPPQRVQGPVAHALSGGGGGGGWAPSVHVLCPPGGASSIVFG